MGAEIDRLEVQVEAQATKANNQLDKLVTKLDKVSGALSNLNSSGLVGRLQVAQVADSISKIGDEYIQKAIVKLPALAMALNNFMARHN